MFITTNLKILHRIKKLKKNKQTPNPIFYHPEKLLLVFGCSFFFSFKFTHIYPDSIKYFES